VGYIFETNRINKIYKLGDGSDFYAIKNVDINIEEGKLTILKGRSGSGKTTLINMLGMLDNPTSGNIFYFGKDATIMKEKERELIRRYDMGYVFQSVALLPMMTVYENIEIALLMAEFKGDKRKRIENLLEMVGLSNRINYMAGRLSGGEQQRIGIVRSVAHRPKVVFADEPTGALDTISGIAVMNLFRKLVEEENTSIIMTTHDENLMELGDCVFSVMDGELKYEK